MACVVGRQRALITIKITSISRLSSPLTISSTAAGTSRAVAIDLVSKNGATSQNEDENPREGEEKGVCSERRAGSDVSPIARLRQSVHLPTIQKIPSELGRPMAELRPCLHSGVARPED